MTVARDLAEFLTGTSSADLPPQAVEHAAMLIASTLASAAMGIHQLIDKVRVGAPPTDNIARYRPLTIGALRARAKFGRRRRAYRARGGRA